MDGLDKVLKNMRELSTGVQRRAARKAARSGAAIVRNRAREIVKQHDDPDTPNAIWKNIVVRSGRTRVKGDVKVRVGVLGGARDMSKHGEVKGSGKGNPGGDTFYWRFLEFGTEKMPARPFMRPAAAEGAQEAYAAVAQTLGTEINKEISRLK